MLAPEVPYLGRLLTELHAGVPDGTSYKPHGRCCVVLTPDVPYLGCSVLTELHAGLRGGASRKRCADTRITWQFLATQCSLSCTLVYPAVLAVSLTEAAVLCWCPQYPAVLGLLSAH